MSKTSWLVTGIIIFLSLGLLSCGYVKKDVLEKQLTDYKIELDMKYQMAQDTAVKASDKADKNLEISRKEIAKAKTEAVAEAEAKDEENMVAIKLNMEQLDKEVRLAAQKAAEKALADAKSFATAEDENVKQESKMATNKAIYAAEEADRKAMLAIREAELAKELPKQKEPIKFAVYFDPGKAQWKKDGNAELAKAAEIINGNPNVEIKIEGHTDDTPVVRARKYKNNWGLSQARAEAVKDYLVKNLGVSSDIIKSSVGLAFYNPDDAEKSLNRRAEVIIIPVD